MILRPLSRLTAILFRLGTINIRQLAMTVRQLDITAIIVSTCNVIIFRLGTHAHGHGQEIRHGHDPLSRVRALLFRLGTI